MPFTNAGAQQIAWALGSNLSNNYIQYFAVGIGSATAGVGNVTMVTETGARSVLTGSPNFATARKVGFQFDFNSVEMSGIRLFEFGFLGSATGSTGSIWQIERIGSIVFDGTSELQITNTIEVLRG